MEPEYEPHQERDVLRVVAHHTPDFWRQFVIHSFPHEHDPVQGSICRAFVSAPASSLGALEGLPNELVSDICAYLDISTCFRFRQVNRRARQVISASREYRAVTEHGLECLRSVLRTSIASWFTISDLYRRLLQRDCTLCGSFGGFVFLPTMTRFCFECVQPSDVSGVVALSKLSKAASVSTHRLRRLLPVLRTVPGRYGPGRTERTRVRYLVSDEQATQLLQALGIMDTPQALYNGVDYLHWAYMVCTVLPYLDLATTEAENGLKCQGCRARCQTPRFNFDDVDRAAIVYSRQGFLRHFQVCDHAKRLWRSSQGGLVEPDFGQDEEV